MKIKQWFVPLAALCGIAFLVGCASPNRQMSESLFDEKTLQGTESPSSAELSQGLNADGTVNFEEWQHFDTNAGAKENFSELDESGDGQINWTEFLKQATKHSKRYQFFADTDKINDGYVSWDKELFRQPGWQLFSIRF